MEDSTIVETKPRPAELAGEIIVLEDKVDIAITEARRCERLLAVSSGAHPRYPEVLAVQEAHDRLVILISKLMA